MFKQTLTISAQQAGQRIDALCAAEFPAISRSRWTKYGEFKCNKIAKTSKHKVKQGETWLVECAEEASGSHLEPWDTPLEILAETDSWVAINKPYGVSVHPSVSEASHQTIVNALVHHFGQNLSDHYDEIEGRRVPRPGLVHRLDKTTSGVLLVAKTNAAHKYFQNHWSKFTKTYTALVFRTPPATGNIESGIARDPHDRKKMMATQADEKWSVTEFKTLETGLGPDKNWSRLKVVIRTGRTHQIRVHLSSIGFPVVGDELYDGRPAPRVMLHAQSLAFKDPDTGKEVLVEVLSPF